MKRGKSGSKSLIKDILAISKKNGKRRSPKRASEENQKAYFKAIKQDSFRRRSPSHKEIKCPGVNEYTFQTVSNVAYQENYNRFDNITAEFETVLDMKQKQGIDHENIILRPWQEDLLRQIAHPTE